MIITREQFEDLCNAIIVRAVTDYRWALAGRRVDRDSPVKVIRECEAFFRSDAFASMTDAITGEELIARLRKEAKEKKEAKENARRARTSHTESH